MPYVRFGAGGAYEDHQKICGTCLFMWGIDIVGCQRKDKPTQISNSTTTEVINQSTETRDRDGPR